MTGFTIGQVAKRAGVNIDTLRYYERRRLVDEPPRSVANYRRYPEETVQRVRFIKRAQELGFSLEEIRELLTLRAAPKARCVEVRRRAEEKMRDIDEKMRALRRMKRALGTLIAECRGDSPLSECPILEAFSGEDRQHGREK